MKRIRYFEQDEGIMTSNPLPTDKDFLVVVLYVKKLQYIIFAYGSGEVKASGTAKSLIELKKAVKKKLLKLGKNFEEEYRMPRSFTKEETYE